MKIKQPVFALKSVGLAIAISLSGLAQAQSLPQLLAETANHPLVLAQLARAGATKTDIDVAQAAGKPRVSAGLGTLAANSASGSKSTLVAPSVTASVPLYDYGRVNDDVQAKTFLNTAATVRADSEREALNRRVLDLYSEVLRQQQSFAVLTQHIQALEGLRNKVQAIATIDSGRRSEVLQVQTRVGALMSTRDAAGIAAREGLTQLQQLLQRSINIREPLPDLSAAKQLPASLGDALNLINQHPQVIAARADSDAAQANARLSSKWDKPRWTLDANAASVRDSNGKQKLLNSLTMQLNANLDLFDGGAGAARSSGEQQRLLSAQAAVDAVKRELVAELGRNWNLMPLREQRLRQINTQLTLAQQLRAAGQEQFEAGRRPLTDQINFENDYFSTLLQQRQEEVEQYATQWRIIAALGQLSQFAQPIKSGAIPVISNVAQASPTPSPSDITIESNVPARTPSAVVASVSLPQVTARDQTINQTTPSSGQTLATPVANQALKRDSSSLMASTAAGAALPPKAAPALPAGLSW